MKNKKLICFPFIDGDLQEYSHYNLNDDERERVYNGECVETPVYVNKKITWKPNEEVELTLNYDGCGRGRSSVTFYWKDNNGHKYPMFLTDMDALIKQDVKVSNIHGIFTYVKRGANYGIKFLREVK